MFTENLNGLQNISQLSPDSRTALLKHISQKDISKGDYVLKYGEICKHIYYVNKGFIRILMKI